MNYKDFPLKEEELKIGFKWYKYLDPYKGRFTPIRCKYYLREIIGEYYGNDVYYIQIKYWYHRQNETDGYAIRSIKRRDLYDILYEDFKLKEEYHVYKYGKDIELEIFEKMVLHYKK